MKSVLNGQTYKQLTTTGGQVGFGVSMALGFLCGAGGSYAKANDWDDFNLDIALKLAGSGGGAMATSVWGQAEQAHDELGQLIDSFRSQGQ
jgi:hypothetical protein